MIDGIKIVIKLFVFTTLFSIPLGIVIAYIRVSKK